MLLRVDPLSPTPLFEQLAVQVKAAVARGELEQGDRLPSVRELARRVSINPNTVAKAYQALESEGVVVRRQGAGVFVKGGAHALAREERARRLAELCATAAPEAYHLGFGEEQLRAAFEAALSELRFPDRETG